MFDESRQRMKCQEYACGLIWKQKRKPRFFEMWLNIDKFEEGNGDVCDNRTVTTQDQSQ